MKNLSGKSLLGIAVLAFIGILAGYLAGWAVWWIYGRIQVLLQIEFPYAALQSPPTIYLVAWSVLGIFFFPFFLGGIFWRGAGGKRPETKTYAQPSDVSKENEKSALRYHTIAKELQLTEGSLSNGVVENLSEAVMRNPTDWEWQYELAEVHMLRGQASTGQEKNSEYAMAKNNFQQLAANFPESAGYGNCLIYAGLLSYELKLPQEAEQYLHDAIDLIIGRRRERRNSDSARYREATYHLEYLYLLLGKVQEELQKKDKAIASYHSAFPSYSPAEHHVFVDKGNITILDRSDSSVLTVRIRPPEPSCLMGI